MKKENKVILILLCITVVAIIIFVVLNISIKKSENVNPQNINNIKEYIGKDLSSGNLSINDKDVLILYSYVYPAHFFFKIDDNGNLVVPNESLFSDKLITVSQLSNDYKMSMAYSIIKNDTTITKSNMASAYMRIFGEYRAQTSFYCYSMDRLGKASYNLGQYHFEGKNFNTGELFDGNFVLVNVKRGDSNTIELYEAEYRYDYNEDNVSLELPSKYNFYGKSENVVFSLSSEEISKGQEYIETKVRENADAFKQNKITFTFVPSSGYYLTSVEPVA